MFNRLRSKLTRFKDTISSRTIDEKSISTILHDLKMTLVEGGVAYDVAEELCLSVVDKLEGSQIPRLKNRSKLIQKVFEESFKEILAKTTSLDIFPLILSKRSSREPFIIVFMGVNGVGKTTSMAKVAYLLQEKQYTVVMACSDTFRSGALEQLEEHGKQLGIRVIHHKYGSDAAAVAFDAINYATAHGVHVVLVDTAGRMHTDRNLMDEMRKVVRIAKPDLRVLVVDSLTGNDAIEQCKLFDEEVGIDAVFLTKFDADEKGGTVFSVSATIGKPILFIGVGQRYGDIDVFNPELFVKNLIGDEQRI